MFIRDSLKYAFFHLTRYTGLNYLVRQARGRGLLVLSYHGVVSKGHRNDRYLYRNTVSQREFEQQLVLLARLFRPIAPADLLAWAQGRATLPERAVLLTFDDGYRNNLTLAAPLLIKYGFPALISVPVGYIGQREILWPQEVEVRVLRWPRDTLPLPGNEPDRPLEKTLSARMALADYVRHRCKRLPDNARRSYLERLRQEPLDGTEDWDEELFGFLSWDDVRALRARGFEIGSHGVQHSILTRISPQELGRELGESKATIEREVGSECFCIAYPNGGPDDFSLEVTAQARATGYKLGFTVMGGLNAHRQYPLTLDRVPVPGHLPLSFFHGIISGVHALLRRT